MEDKAKLTKIAIKNMHLLSFVLSWGPLQGMSKASPKHVTPGQPPYILF